jgi:hypothetical protein
MLSTDPKTKHAHRVLCKGGVPANARVKLKTGPILSGPTLKEQDKAEFIECKVATS